MNITYMHTRKEKQYIQFHIIHTLAFKWDEISDFSQFFDNFGNKRDTNRHVAFKKRKDGALQTKRI